MCMCTHLLSHVWFFATPWTVACQALLSREFSRQEYWSGLPFPPPWGLPNPRIEPTSLASPALAGGFFTTVPLINIAQGISSKPFNCYMFPEYFYTSSSCWCRVPLYILLSVSTWIPWRCLKFNIFKSELTLSFHQFQLSPLLPEWRHHLQSHSSLESQESPS